MSVSPHARQIMSIGNTESQKKGAHKETQIQCRVSTAAQMHVDRRCRVVFGVRWRPKWSVVQFSSPHFESSGVSLSCVLLVATQTAN